MPKPRVTNQDVKTVERFLDSGLGPKRAAEASGLSRSTVNAIRAGIFEGRGGGDLQICPACRVPVFMPCHACAMRDAALHPERYVRPGPPIAADDPLREKLETPLTELGLQVRTVNYLEELNAFDVNDLLHLPRERLQGKYGFGAKTMQSIFGALAKLGFVKKPDPGPSVVSKVLSNGVSNHEAN